MLFGGLVFSLMKKLLSNVIVLGSALWNLFVLGHSFFFFIFFFFLGSQTENHFILEINFHGFFSSKIESPLVLLPTRARTRIARTTSTNKYTKFGLFEVPVLVTLSMVL